MPVAKPTLSIPINKPTNMLQVNSHNHTVTIRAANINSASSRILCLPLCYRLKVFISCHDAIWSVSEAYGLIWHSAPTWDCEAISTMDSSRSTNISTTDSSLTQLCSDSAVRSVWFITDLIMSQLELQHKQQYHPNSHASPWRSMKPDRKPVVLICLCGFIRACALSKEVATSFA